MKFFISPVEFINNFYKPPVEIFYFRIKGIVTGRVTVVNACLGKINVVIFNTCNQMFGYRIFRSDAHSPSGQPWSGLAFSRNQV